MLVGSDMISDGGVLVQMWPYTMWAKILAGEYAVNETATNSTGTTANSSSTELAGDQEGNGTVVGSNSTEVEQGRQSDVLDFTLGFLFMVSIITPLGPVASHPATYRPSSPITLPTTFGTIPRPVSKGREASALTDLYPIDLNIQFQTILI